MAEKNKDTQEETPVEGSGRLCRLEKGSIVGGVSAGLGEYFNIDPSILRLIFVLLTIFGGSGIPIYIVLWIILPKCGKENLDRQSSVHENVQELKEKARSFAQEIRINRKEQGKEDSRFWWGIIILVLGFMFLFSNLGLFEFADFTRFWPLVLILFGLAILTRP
jgi:phage shock protein C